MTTPNLYRSSYGGLRLWISKLSTDRSRSQIVHDLSAGDDFVVQDRGRSILKANATLIFDYMDGDDLAPEDRARKLISLADDKARTFSHPLEGSFLARVGPFKYDIDQDSVISAEVEFTAVSNVVAVSSAAAAAVLGPGGGAVDSAADAMTAELADIGRTSTLPQAAKDAAASWSETDLINPRDVLAQTGSLTSQLGTESDGYDTDVGMWSAFKATVVLAEAVRLAAAAATASSSSTFVMRTGTPIALRALLASIYPADEAAARYDEVIALNDIASPAWIDMGSELVLPSPSPLARST